MLLIETIEQLFNLIPLVSIANKSVAKLPLVEVRLHLSVLIEDGGEVGRNNVL